MLEYNELGVVMCGSFDAVEGVDSVVVDGMTKK
jgi:hypothetical protein